MFLFRISSFSRFLTVMPLASKPLYSECDSCGCVARFSSVSSPWITLLCYSRQFGGWGPWKRWLHTHPSYLQASISTGEAGEILVLRALYLIDQFFCHFFLKEFDWPIEGLLVPNSPPLKKPVCKTLEPCAPVRLRVVRNGDKNKNRALTITGPDISPGRKTQ